MASAEYLIGEFPEADGSDYDPFSISPTFVRILQHMEKLKMKRVRISIVGKLYAGTDKFGRKISGDSRVLSIEEIRNAARRQGISYEQKWQELFGMNTTPLHITGVSLKPV